MMIQLDFEAEMPIYQQLVNQIKEGLATGQLQPGEALPSVRVLAADIGINMHTVNKAYKILKEEGFLQIHRQKGVVVSPQLPKVDQAFLERTQETLKTLIVEAATRGMEEQAFYDECKHVFEWIQSVKR